jgi:HAD superfamily hydrolase (TIGR01459 family)
MQPPDIMKTLSAEFPVWFCDIWGVVHNGEKPFLRTCSTLAQHRANGGKVILVTNSPRTAQGVKIQLADIGVQHTAYDEIVTSGDVTRSLMLQYGGGSVFHIGPQRDLSIFDNLNVKIVELAKAKAVVCTGLKDEVNERPEDYRALLMQIHNLGLPFISANPDKIVRKGLKLIYCAGAVAEEFTKLGGAVLMAGKPLAPIYELALTTAQNLRGRKLHKSEILAIGDGPETDILGAANFGLQCVLITGGINTGSNVRQHVMAHVPHAKILADMPELDWV